MELDAVNRKRAVRQPHDQAIVGLRGHRQLAWYPRARPRANGSVALNGPLMPC
jgi:hypothetical protein